MTGLARRDPGGGWRASAVCARRWRSNQVQHLRVMGDTELPRERFGDSQDRARLASRESRLLGHLAARRARSGRLTAIDLHFAFASVKLVGCSQGNPTRGSRHRSSRAASRHISAPPAGAWSACSLTAASPLARLRLHARGARRPPHADPRRPAANERRRRGPPWGLIVEECWRPAFARYLYAASPPNAISSATSGTTDSRPHHGRLSGGRIPGEIVYAT
jgi:hypothetical protein